MNLSKLLFVVAFTGFAVNSFGQDKKLKTITEVLQYVSAVYDPISEGIQIEFKGENNEKRLFNYNKQDVLKPEEMFFNQPVLPITDAGKNLTRQELVGKGFKVVYYSLIEPATPTCCFKMKTCDSVTK